MKNNHKSAPIRTFLIILCAALIFAAAGGSYLYKLNELQNKETELYLSEIARQEASAVHRQIQGDLQSLRATSMALSLRRDIWASKEETLEFVRQESTALPFQWIAFIDKEGRLYGAGDGVEVTEGADFSYRDYFQHAIQGEEYVSSVFEEAYTKKKRVAYAVPIYQDSEIVGVLAAMQGADTFSRLMDTNSFRGSGYSHLMHSSGKIFLYSGRADASQISDFFDYTFADPESVSFIRANTQHLGLGVTKVISEGTPRWAAYAPVGVQDWYILNIVPVDAVNTQFLKFIGITVVALAILLIAVMLFFLYLHRMRKWYEGTTYRLAFVDSLTGLNNRNRFDMEVKERLSRKSFEPWLIVTLDISRFKEFNELFGIALGDRLLCYIADTVSPMVKEDELFARATADHFFLLLKEADNTSVTRRVNSMMEEISRFEVSFSMNYTIVMRCGIYRLEEKDTMMDIKLLTDRAAFALRGIRSSYVNHLAFYNEAMHEGQTFRVELENMMYQALHNGEFVIYYQPQYDVSSGRIVGAEALVRWDNPAYGMIMPDSFIPLFEENGFVTELDDYVLSHVCKSIGAWRKEGKPAVPVSVNQSRLHLYDPSYLDNIRETVQRYQVPVGMIQLEITESSALSDLNRMLEVSHSLQEMGFSVSMDDFGSGYSSLNLLREMDVDELKLDKLFFIQGNDSPRWQEIISCVLHMARNLSMRTVAEGIETWEQVEFLKKEKCDVAQGYYFAKPMPQAEFEALLLRQHA